MTPLLSSSTCLSAGLFSKGALSYIKFFNKYVGLAETGAISWKRGKDGELPRAQNKKVDWKSPS